MKDQIISGGWCVDLRREKLKKEINEILMCNSDFINDLAGSANRSSPIIANFQKFSVTWDSRDLYAAEF